MVQHSIIAVFRNGGKAVVKLVEKGGRRSCLKSYRNLGGSSSCAGVTGEHRGAGICSALFLWVVSWKGQLNVPLRARQGAEEASHVSPPLHGQMSSAPH